MEKLKKCPFCKKGRTKKLFKIRDFSNKKDECFCFSECLDCGIGFLSERPYEKDILKYYSRDYSPFAGDYNFLISKFIKIRVSKEAKSFEKINSNITDILEIGCANGRYLKQLKDIIGCNVVGIDSDKNSCEIGKKKFGLDIRNVDLLGAGFEEDSFDLVVMNHVIEHLYNPKEVIQEIFRIMRKGGVLLIRTPNLQTIERHIFGKFWFPYETPRHLIIFSKKTISMLLSSVGFKLLTVKYEKTPNNIILSIKNFFIDKRYCLKIASFFNINNYLLLILITPISFVLGVFKSSGRMVVVARKEL